MHVFILYLFFVVCCVMFVLLVCPIQCPNENDQMEKRFYIDADIPKWYSFLFRTLFNWYFLYLFRLVCLFFSSACLLLFLCFWDFGLVACGWFYRNKCDERIVTSVQTIYTIHKDVWIISISIFFISICQFFPVSVVSRLRFSLGFFIGDIAVKLWQMKANCGGTQKRSQPPIKINEDDKV